MPALMLKKFGTAFGHRILTVPEAVIQNRSEKLVLDTNEQMQLAAGALDALGLVAIVVFAPLERAAGLRRAQLDHAGSRRVSVVLEFRSIMCRSRRRLATVNARWPTKT